MSEYVVGAFLLAAVLVVVMIFPAVRLAGGFALLIAGVVSMMFAMFFGPPLAAIGLLVVLLELHGRFPKPPEKLAGRGHAHNRFRKPV